MKQLFLFGARICRTALLGGSPGAAECAWRHADDLTEDAAEVVGGIETDAQGNLGQGQVSIDEQGLGLADAPAAQVLKRGVVGRVLERMGDIVAAGVEMLGNVADGEVFGIMLFDVRAGVFRFSGSAALTARFEICCHTRWTMVWAAAFAAGYPCGLERLCSMMR